MQEWQKTQEMMINKIVVERAKTIDDAIFGEIQEIATENGIETKILISKEAVANALKKQIPKKPKDYPLSDGQCPTCNAVFDYDWKPKSRFCQNCGQRLDWSEP